jgi:hypothetical protein
MLTRIFKRKFKQENHELISQMIPFELKPYVKTEITNYIYSSKSDMNLIHSPFLI